MVYDLVLSCTYLYLGLSLGDLFIDGKVIHRPQYTSDMRQQATRNRPRPRYDRRRETMQVQRREMHRPNMANPGVPAQQPTSMDSQNSARVEGGTSQWTASILTGAILGNSWYLEFLDYWIKVWCCISYLMHNDWVPYVPCQLMHIIQHLYEDNKCEYIVGMRSPSYDFYK